jgi:hypothetical protein
MNIKTFGELTCNDILYTHTGHKIKITSIHHYDHGAKSKISLDCYSYSQDCDPKLTSQQLQTSGGYIAYSILYTSEYEYKIHKKEELIKTFDLLKGKALNAFNEVVKFRSEHLEELNALTTRQLEELKKDNL